MLGAFNPRQNRRLWTLLDRPDFAAIDDWPGLWAAAAEMREALTLTLRGRSAAAWEDLLAAAGVPARRVRTVAEAASLPHLGARDYFHTFRDRCVDKRDDTTRPIPFRARRATDRVAPACCRGAQRCCSG